MNQLALEKSCYHHIIKKRDSGRILLYSLYEKLGIHLPKDMCYEISLYLVYDIRTPVYQEVFQKNCFLFLYKEILNDSIQLMSRYKEIVIHPNKKLSKIWYVLSEDTLFEDNLFLLYNNYVMSACNCPQCGCYENTYFWYCSHCFSELW